MNFKKFVDASEIERIYDKAKIAVDLVNMFDPHILDNVSTIANLASGAYGLYNSGENRNILPPDQENRIIFQGKIPKDKVEHLPIDVLKQYIPNLDARTIKRGDVIRVNVNRILHDPKVKSDLDAIVQLASTIVHESTHDNEMRTKGSTNEVGPEVVERKFMTWFQNNKQAQQFVQNALGSSAKKFV